VRPRGDGWAHAVIPRRRGVAAPCWRRAIRVCVGFMVMSSLIFSGQLGNSSACRRFFFLRFRAGGLRHGRDISPVSATIARRGPSSHTSKRCRRRAQKAIRCRFPSQSAADAAAGRRLHAEDAGPVGANATMSCRCNRSRRMPACASTFRRLRRLRPARIVQGFAVGLIVSRSSRPREGVFETFGGQSIPYIPRHSPLPAPALFRIAGG